MLVPLSRWLFRFINPCRNLSNYLKSCQISVKASLKQHSLSVCIQRSLWPKTLSLKLSFDCRFKSGTFSALWTMTNFPVISSFSRPPTPTARPPSSLPTSTGKPTSRCGRSKFEIPVWKTRVSCISETDVLISTKQLPKYL